MAYVQSLKCRECGRTYDIAPIYTCEWCFGPLEIAYDYEAIAGAISRESVAAGPNTIWRYAPLLPVDVPGDATLPVGCTPLLRADRLAAELGLGEVWIKDDTRNPTNAFKDRVVAVALAKTLEFGLKTLACASTGNLANAVAAHAARAGLRSFVFIPSDLEAGKVLTTSVYGGNVVAIDGNYDDVNRLCAELAAERPWAFVNVNIRPFYAEGSKTLAFETAEQLGWQTPDHVIVPMASGSLLTKIRKGFDELHTVGLLDHAPEVRVSGAQAAGCSPIAAAFARAERHHLAGAAEHDRQVARDREPGGRLLRARRRARDRRRHGGGVRRGDRRRHAPARPHRGRVRRDGRGGHGRHPEAARRRRGGAARRAGRRLRHRSWAQDAGRHRRAGGPDGDDRPHARRLPRGVPDVERGLNPMAISIRIPTQLRELSGGASETSVEGATVGEALTALDAAHPGFAQRLYDEKGGLRRFVNVFVDDEDIRFLTGLETPLAAGQTLSIVPAVAGG